MKSISSVPDTEPTRSPASGLRWIAQWICTGIVCGTVALAIWYTTYLPNAMPTGNHSSNPGDRFSMVVGPGIALIVIGFAVLFALLSVLAGVAHRHLSKINPALRTIAAFVLSCLLISAFLFTAPQYYALVPATASVHYPQFPGGIVAIILPFAGLLVGWCVVQVRGRQHRDDA